MVSFTCQYILVQATANSISHLNDIYLGYCWWRSVEYFGFSSFGLNLDTHILWIASSKHSPTVWLRSHLIHFNRSLLQTHFVMFPTWHVKNARNQKEACLIFCGRDQMHHERLAELLQMKAIWTFWVPHPGIEPWTSSAAGKHLDHLLLTTYFTRILIYMTNNAPIQWSPS